MLKALTCIVAIEIEKNYKFEIFKVHLYKHTSWVMQAKLIFFLSFFDTTVNLRSSSMHDTPVFGETPFTWKTMWEMCKFHS